MRPRPLLPLLTLLTTLSAAALAATSSTPAAPVPAREVLADVQAKAKASGRTPLVLFHASWCGWCRKLERTLASPEVSGVLGKYFESAWLDVLERPGRKHLENPGGNELLASWGGADAGLPFYAVLDAKGNVLASALMTGPDGTITGASGFPGTPGEIEHFLAMIRKGAPRMTPAEIDALRKAFPVLPAARPAR